MRQVEDSEVDPGEYRAYFDVVAAHSEPLGAAMLEMSRTAGIAARSLNDKDLTEAAHAMERVTDSATAFLHELSAVRCPAYVRGANDQLVDAVKRAIRAGQQGAAAAGARSADGVVAAGNEIETATDEFMEVAQRFTDWRSGAARPPKA